MQQGPAAVNDRMRIMLLSASTVHQPDPECCFGLSSALPARRWTSARWLSRWVRLDLVAVAAAVFCLTTYTGCGQVGDDAVGAVAGDA
jgi:hypothetical protein